MPSPVPTSDQQASYRWYCPGVSRAEAEVLLKKGETSARLVIWFSSARHIPGKRSSFVSRVFHETITTYEFDFDRSSAGEFSGGADSRSVIFFGIQEVFR